MLRGGRISWAMVFLLLILAGLGGSLLRDARENLVLYEEGRRVLEVRQLLKETEYFLQRQNRAVLGYILLLDEAEKLQIHQTQEALARRLDVWARLAGAGRASREDLEKVNQEALSMAYIRLNAMTLSAQGRRREAIAVAENDFVAATARAASNVKKSFARLDARDRLLRHRLSQVALRSRLSVAAAVLAAFLVVYLGREIRYASAVPVRAPASAPLKAGGYRSSSSVLSTHRTPPPRSTPSPFPPFRK